jgi:hyperosmotically inducible periplasmic protein
MLRLPALILGAAIAFTIDAQEDAPSDHLDDAENTGCAEAALIRDEAAITPDVDPEGRGFIQLSGFVDDEQVKRAIEAAARSVAGVTQVRNDLIVRQAERTPGAVVDDPFIAARVKSALATDAGLRTAPDLYSEVRDGIVQLGGFVESVQQKTRAATLASSIEGVQDVHNEIVVRR